MRTHLTYLAIALAGAVCAPACSPSHASAPVDLRYDFSSCRDTWPQVTDPDGGHVGCRDGAYVIGVATRGHPEISRVVYGPVQPRVSITTRVSTVANRSVQGVGCWRDPAHGYLFVSSTDGTFAILRQAVRGIGTPARVAVGWDPGAAYGEQGTTLAASCAAAARGTVLSFAIGGRAVARVTDRNGLRG